MHLHQGVGIRPAVQPARQRPHNHAHVHARAAGGGVGGQVWRGQAQHLQRAAPQRAQHAPRRLRPRKAAGHAVRSDVRLQLGVQVARAVAHAPAPELERVQLREPVKPARGGVHVSGWVGCWIVGVWDLQQLSECRQPGRRATARLTAPPPRRAPVREHELAALLQLDIELARPAAVQHALQPVWDRADDLKGPACREGGSRDAGSWRKADRLIGGSRVAAGGAAPARGVALHCSHLQLSRLQSLRIFAGEARLHCVWRAGRERVLPTGASEAQCRL